MALTITYGGSARNLPGAVYAQDYGVVSDGVTDCASALNAAIVAAAGVSDFVRTTVYLPSKDASGNCIKVGSQIVVRNGVTLKGQGKNSTLLQATSGFPTNTPVVRLGDAATPIAFNQRLEGLGVDCFNVTDSTAVYSRNSNEGSGCFNFIAANFTKYGIHYDQCSIVYNMDIELFGQPSGATIAAFYFQSCAGQNYLQGATLNVDNTTGDCCLCDGGQYRISDIHCEQGASGGTATNGIHLKNCSAEVNDIHGNPDGPYTLIRIDANTRNVIVSNVYINGGPGPILVDSINGNTISGPSNVEHYVQDNMRIGPTVFRTGTGPPGSGTYTRGEIVWNSTPSASGTPGWVCVTAGTPGTWKAMANLAA